jgi:hypothetical protein
MVWHTGISEVIRKPREDAPDDNPIYCGVTGK